MKPQVKSKQPWKLRREFQISILQANSIITAIPKEWKSIKECADPEEVNVLYTKVLQKARPTAFFYREIASQYSAIGHCYNKWAEKLPGLELGRHRNSV